VGSDIIDHCEKKKVYMNKCLTLNSYRDRAVWISRPNSIIFLFAGLYKERRLQKKGWYTRQIARSHSGCCCPHTET